MQDFIKTYGGVIINTLVAIIIVVILLGGVTLGSQYVLNENNISQKGFGNILTQIGKGVDLVNDGKNEIISNDNIINNANIKVILNTQPVLMHDASDSTNWYYLWQLDSANQNTYSSLINISNNSSNISNSDIHVVLLNIFNSSGKNAISSGQIMTKRVNNKLLVGFMDADCYTFKIQVKSTQNSPYAFTQEKNVNIHINKTKS